MIPRYVIRVVFMHGLAHMSGVMAALNGLALIGLVAPWSAPIMAALGVQGR